MTLALRPASPDDSRLFWTLRNADDVRAASRDAAPIPWERHQAWFAGALASPDRRLFVAQAGAPAGVIRFDRVATAQDAWLVSITVAPERRGEGLGRAMLGAGCARLRRENPACAFVADIREDNAASARIFEACGFALEGREGPWRRYRAQHAE